MGKARRLQLLCITGLWQEEQKLPLCRRDVGMVVVKETVRGKPSFLPARNRSVLLDYREGLRIRSAGYKLCSVEKMACS